MAETPKFDLQKILDESTKKLKEQIPEAHQLLAQAAANNMQTHLTPNQTSNSQSTSRKSRF
jgi:hypothetical protein